MEKVKSDRLTKRYAFVNKYQRFCRVNGYPKVLESANMVELWQVIDSILDFEEEAKDFLEFNTKYPDVRY